MHVFPCLEWFYIANKKALTPSDLAEIIKNHGYQDGMSVRIVACQTALGKNSFAEQLAKIMKAKVIAYPNKIYIDGKDNVVHPPQEVIFDYR